jgi:hypothetical protein
VELQLCRGREIENEAKMRYIPREGTEEKATEKGKI